MALDFDPFPGRFIALEEEGSRRAVMGLQIR